jgi:hypothetical protein
MIDGKSLQSELKRMLGLIEAGIESMQGQIKRSSDMEIYVASKKASDDIETESTLMNEMKEKFSLTDDEVKRIILGRSGIGSFMVPTGSRPSLYGVPTVNGEEQSPEMQVLRRLMTSDPEVKKQESPEDAMEKAVERLGRAFEEGVRRG